MQMRKEEYEREMEDWWKVWFHVIVYIATVEPK